MKMAENIFHSSTPVAHGSAMRNPLKVKTKRYQTVLDLVLEAIKAVGLKGKGASYQAILKYIQNAKEDEAEGQKKLRATYLRKAITKGLEEGLIKKSDYSTDTKGLLGYYVLTQKSKPVKPKPVPGETTKNPEVRTRKLSDVQVIRKVPKMPRKLNLSDSALLDLDTINKPTVNKNNFDLLVKKGKPKAVHKTLKLERKAAQPKHKISKPEKTDVNPEKAKPKTLKPVKGERRWKDVSDSEMVVRKPSRKSLKSYSSDTEVSIISAKNKPKKENSGKKVGPKADPKRNKIALEVTQTIIEAPSKATNSRKLYNKEAIAAKNVVEPKKKKPAKNQT